MESSVMLGSIPFFIQPHFGVFLRWRCTAPLAHADVGRFFGGDGDGNQKAKATAEGRLYNHSPRLACLPGVSRGIIIYRRRAVV